jgi:hypothetical protein
MVGTVQDLVISELYGKKFVFALHLDGTLRIWDLVSHSRVFSHNMGVMLMAGTVYLLDLILSILYIYVILTLLLSGPLPTIKTTLSIDFCSNHVYMNGIYWETCKWLLHGGFQDFMIWLVDLWNIEKWYVLYGSPSVSNYMPLWQFYTN